MPYYKNHMKRLIDDCLWQIESRIYTEIAPLTLELWRTKEPVTYDHKTEGEYAKVGIGTKWGELWDCAWMHCTGEVPVSAKGKNCVAMLDVAGEGLIFDDNGVPVKGLTSVNAGGEWVGKKQKRTYHLFPAGVQGGEKVDFWVDIACNSLFGDDYDGKMATIMLANLSICNDEIRALYYDMSVLKNLMDCLNDKTARHNAILFALNDVASMLKYYTDDEIKAAREILAVELNKKGGDPSLKITAIGHAHLDLAWLWPERESHRKGARTFTNAIDLMNRYPSYRFGASQAQLFAWIKKDHPSLYQKVKEKVASGQFEVQGGMWVEADTNITGGESLVRQFLYGKQFFKEEFGKEMEYLWLPDVFGYSGALPQIIKKSGCKYFMTQKLSWNEHTKFPHHTFHWAGIDGSSVLAHMLPEDNYNSPAQPSSLHSIEENYFDKGVCDEALMLFGIGDGGGGPCPAHIESLDRMKSLDGLPPVEQGHAIDFFKRIEKKQERYAVERGELYLEKHQGTYTTQAKNKYYNRKMENALRELELYAVIAGDLFGYEYPKETIDELWKKVLFFQFHDILPGSSIDRVYEESVAQYQTMLTKTQDMIRNICEKIADSVRTDFAKPVVVFNPTSFERTEWVCADGVNKRITVPAMGYTTVDFSQSDNVSGLDALQNSIENDFLKVTFDESGAISSMFDKAACKEVIKSGTKGNVLAVYDDKCGNCWDIHITYRQLPPMEFKLQSQRSYTEGSCAIMEQNYAYGDSKIVQKIKLTPENARLDFETTIHWYENQKMLRTSFDVNVFSDTVMCNIAYGKIARTTLQNTLADVAQFEISAHKWIDISERSYGVSLLNDCKYGHYAKGSTLDLNLLRSQSYPSQNADHGVHEVTYSIYPHAGDEVEAKVTNEGYKLNMPLTVYKASGNGDRAPEESFFSISRSNVHIEAAKKAEKLDGVVIRAYEADGISCTAEIKLPYGVKSAQLVDMMENPLSPLEIRGGAVTLDFGKFSIHTVKITY